MKKLIKYLYKKYPIFFAELFTESFLETVPKEVKDPALYLLKEQKNQLERWIVYTVWQIQRKAMGDLKHADFHLGVLTSLKILLTLIRTEREPVKRVEVEEKTNTLLEKALEGVKFFVKGKKE